MIKTKQMASEYIVVNKSTNGSYKGATILTDENGNNKVFSTLAEAEAELAECQSGVIVGTEDIPDFTSVLLDEIASYIREMINVVHKLPEDEKVFVMADLSSPYLILGKIELWKSTMIL